MKLNNGTVLSTNNSFSVDLGVTLSIAIGFTIISGVAAMLLRKWVNKEKATENNREENEQHGQDNEQHGQENGHYKQHFMHILMKLVSIFVFILDITTDIVMTWVYWVDGNSENFWLSLTFTFLHTLPNIVAMIFVTTHLSTNPRFPKFIFFLISFVCSPIIQYVIYTTSLATRSNHNQHPIFKNAAWLAALLGMIETTFESAPQIVLQIYINLKSAIDEELSTRYFRYFTLAASVLGIAMSMDKFEQEVKKWNKMNLKLLSKIVLYLLSIAEIGPRLVILAVFVYVTRIYCIIFFVTHAIIFIIFIIIAFAACRRKNTQNDHQHLNNEEDPRLPKTEEMLTLLLGIFANIFFFFDYKFLDRFNHKLTFEFKKAFYILYYTENAILLAIYLILTNDRNVWYFGGTILAVIVGFASRIVVCIYMYLRTR